MICWRNGSLFGLERMSVECSGELFRDMILFDGRWDFGREMLLVKVCIWYILLVRRLGVLCIGIAHGRKDIGFVGI